MLPVDVGDPEERTSSSDLSDQRLKPIDSSLIEEGNS